jgi:hypothetical protein
MVIGFSRIGRNGPLLLAHSSGGDRGCRINQMTGSRERAKTRVGLMFTMLREGASSLVTFCPCS